MSLQVTFKDEKDVMNGLFALLAFKNCKRLAMEYCEGCRYFAGSQVDHMQGCLLPDHDILMLYIDEATADINMERINQATNAACLLLGLPTMVYDETIASPLWTVLGDLSVDSIQQTICATDEEDNYLSKLIEQAYNLYVDM